MLCNQLYNSTIIVIVAKIIRKKKFNLKNLIRDETYFLCIWEHLVQEFKTWSKGDDDIDKIIQESQTDDIGGKLYWIPYNNFQNIEHVTDGAMDPCILLK